MMRNPGLDVRDVLALAGFAALLYGVSRWSAPAAWVVGGALVLVVSLWPYVRRGDGRSVIGGRLEHKEKRS